jgi:hypothetical protein
MPERSVTPVSKRSYVKLGFHVLANPFVVQRRWGLYTKRYSVLSFPAGPRRTNDFDPEDFARFRSDPKRQAMVDRILADD